MIYKIYHHESDAISAIVRPGIKVYWCDITAPEVLRIIMTVHKYSAPLLPSTRKDCTSSPLFKLSKALWSKPLLYWIFNNQRVICYISFSCHTDCGKNIKKKKKNKKCVGVSKLLSKHNTLLLAQNGLCNLKEIKF